jgi:hypothetical protein
MQGKSGEPEEIKNIVDAYREREMRQTRVNAEEQESQTHIVQDLTRRAFEAFPPIMQLGVRDHITNKEYNVQRAEDSEQYFEDGRAEISPREHSKVDSSDDKFNNKSGSDAHSGV